MPRGALLSTLRTLLKAELRESQETNATADAEFNYALASAQIDLANQHDWPFLRHSWDVNLVQGTRFYDFPTSDVRSLACTINFARPVQAYTASASCYIPVDYDISPEDYGVADESTQSDPVRRWQVVTNTSESANPDEIEVWPIPASSGTLRLQGQRNVLALASDSDKADLDDRLLVYRVAADYLAQRDQKNAPLVAAKAQAHLLRLQSAYPSRTQLPVKFGGRHSFSIQPVKYVAIATT